MSFIDLVIALPEAIEGVAKLLNGSRSVIIEVDNNTDFDLTVASSSVQHGGFTTAPSASIPPKTANVFGAKDSANSIWTGTEGTVTYESEQFQATIHWVNPFAGSNECSIMLLGPNAMLFEVRAFAGAGNEKAHMRFVISPSNNSFKIINQHSGKLLEVAGASLGDGAKVQQHTANDGNNQLWKLLHHPDGYYTIVNNHSQKVLDVPDASSADNVKIQKFEQNGGSNQQWRLMPVLGGFFPLFGSVYEIINTHSRKVLDIPSGSVNDGIQVQQYTENGGDNQKWRLQPMDWFFRSTSES